LLYKQVSNSQDTYLIHEYINVTPEGSSDLSFKAVLFVPTNPDDGLFNGNVKKNGFKLYCKQVLITEDTTALLPDWLTFMFGIVDCDNLPLNVSREMVQHNSILKKIKNKIVNSILDSFTKISKDTVKYAEFFKKYGKFLKLAYHNETEKKTKIMDLLRFSHLHGTENEEIYSFRQYKEKMQEEQKNIYFLSGLNKEMLLNSPYLEVVKNKKYDVMFLTEPIDEFISSSFDAYDGVKMLSLAKEGINLTSEDDIKKVEEQNKDFLEFVKKSLTGRVFNVKISSLLNESPCVLTTASFGPSANLERLAKSQAISNNQMQFSTMKVLELNLKNEIVDFVKNNFKRDEKYCDNILNVLYNCCLINGGFLMEDTKSMTGQMYDFINFGLKYYTRQPESIEQNVQVEQVEQNVQVEQTTPVEQNSQEEQTYNYGEQQTI